MNTRSITHVFFILILCCYTSFSKAQGYKIDVSVKGWQDTTLILGHYFNKKMLVNDTIYIDNNGAGTFTGEEKLPGGVYIIYMPDQTYFDIIVDDEQHFSITANKENPVQSLVIHGNKQEKAFNDYQKFIFSKQEKAKEIQEKLKDKDQYTKEQQDTFKKQLSELSTDVQSYWDKILHLHEGTFLASFIKAMREIEVPDFKALNQPDSVIQVKRYQYYKQHYFDNIDMNDDRLLRTPFFTGKLENFFSKTILQLPDSIVKEAVRVIDMAKGNKDMEKYLIQFTFNYANESKLMGMDAAMVQLGEKYYLSGIADWVDQEFIDKLEDRITKLKPNLIGNTAPDLKMVSPNNQYYRLSEVYAPITILIFWEPDCGHCKKEIPKLKELVWDKYQDVGVKIFAVFTQHEKEKWTDFIADHQLEEWINVYDPYHQSNFRNLYDIYSTPAIYILDENKKIIGKRIGAEQVPDFIDHQLKLNKQAAASL
ncbi:TlpA family protein disulfide reductase [Saccharicrinis fermentans]|uniref:Thiol-disulfide oxidoreductase n=1 Tax=Saccharicrinis fermentans DSM 9555 = JCM 21142 TaxID=869213 RepID=W7Y5P8_9BACT|nr:TlpA family protein disulfide reductase [Saccharicrinis fermentans]GAF03477.1 thiol-disulfide oxidoreductase [Saccharicrinis fermentans DSM 9555 = JCM 21142]